jgi:hypothetical protein
VGERALRQAARTLEKVTAAMQENPPA